MKVKVENGKVEFLLRAGTHLVRNTTTEVKTIQNMIDKGTVEDSDVEGFDIKVTARVQLNNETYYFKVERPRRKKVSTDEEAV